MSIGKTKMRTFAAVILLVGLLPAAAQNTPKSIRTHRVQTTPASLYMIDKDGTVRTDWRRVEAIAQSAELTDSDIARVLIAVRDGGKAQAVV